MIFWEVQPSSAETALEKSIFDIKKALENFRNTPQNQNTNINSQNSNISDVFGNETPVKQINPKYLWKNKEEFFDAVSKGEMINYEVDQDKAYDRLMTASIGYLLSPSYQLPDWRDNSMCSYLFNDRPIFLIQLINKSKLTRLGDNPPEFIGANEQLVEENNALGRMHLKSLSEDCGTKHRGKNESYPYPSINSLSSLLNDYSKLTESYVNELRLKKVEEYKVSQEKNRVEEIEKITANSQMIVLQKEEEERNVREMKFQEDFKRKEEVKRSQCLASQQYFKFTAAKTIEESLARIKESKNIIKREKEISSKSGYEDGNKLYEQGQIIVYSEENINKSLLTYRKNGGTENNVNKIVAGKNPCLLN